MSADKKRAALYLRISSDSAKTGLGVERQETECRKLAQDRDFEIVAVFIDNDITAFAMPGRRRRPRPRPDFEALLDGAEDGDFDVIVAYASDRLYRTQRDLLEMTDALFDTGIRILTVLEGETDLNTADGIAQAQNRGTWSQHESHRKAERIKARKKQDKQKGRRPGGFAPWAFTLLPGGLLAYDPELAPVVLSLYEDYAAGSGIPTLAARLNTEGVFGRRGKPWYTASLSAWLFTGAAFARQRVRDDQVDTTAQSEPGYARTNWEPVPGCTDELWAAVLAEKARRVRAPHPKRRVPQWFLSGLVVCGECGSKCVTSKIGSAARVFCNSSYMHPGHVTCSGKGSVKRDWLEREAGLVLMSLGEELLDAVTTEDTEAEVKAAKTEKRRLESEIAAVESRLAEAQSAWVMGDTPKEVFDQVQATVQKRLEALQEQRDGAIARLHEAQRLARRSELWAPGGDGPDLLAKALEQLGDGSDTGRWAAVVGDVIESITLHTDRVVWKTRSGKVIPRDRMRKGRPRSAMSAA